MDPAPLLLSSSSSSSAAASPAPAAGAALASAPDYDAEALAEKAVSGLRAFVIARLPGSGYLLLQAIKKRRGRHDQLPGGRVDVMDYFTLMEKHPALAAAGMEKKKGAGAAREILKGVVPFEVQQPPASSLDESSAGGPPPRVTRDPVAAAPKSAPPAAAKAAQQFRREVCRIGVARELYEETGLQIALERFTHLPYLSRNNREYFELILLPSDSRPPINTGSTQPDSGGTSSSSGNQHSSNQTGLPPPSSSAAAHPGSGGNSTSQGPRVRVQAAPNFSLWISKEHIGCRFEENLHDAAAAVAQHSGGEPRVALLAYAAAMEAAEKNVLQIGHGFVSIDQQEFLYRPAVDLEGAHSRDYMMRWSEEPSHGEARNSPITPNSNNAADGASPTFAALLCCEGFLHCIGRCFNRIQPATPSI